MENTARRWWDLPSALLLVTALFLAGTRLQITHWTQSLDQVSGLLLLAGILGLLLGLSKFKPSIAFLMAVLYSLALIPWRLVSGYTEAITWNERLADYLNRIIQSTHQFFINQPVDDPVLFIVLMAILYWSMGILAGYLLTRKGNPVIPVVILGLAVFLIEHYQPGSRKPFYSWAYVVTSVVLFARIFYLKSRQEWNRRGYVVDAETGFDLTRTAVLISLVVVFVAWNLPQVTRAFTSGTPEQRKLQQGWNRFQNRFENMFASFRGATTYEMDITTTDYELGRGQPLGDRLVFTVETDQPAPQGNRYYWRNRSYDFYEYGRWRTQPVISENKMSGEYFTQYLPFQGRSLERFFFKVQTQNMAQLFTPGMPLDVNRRIEGLLTSNGGDNADVVMLLSDPPMKNGSSYLLHAWIANLDVESLRQMDEPDPDWVRTRYLQLPVSLPDRVRDLADEITAGYDNRYDKVMAVTMWLRANMKYADTVPAAPADQDLVDWFLFDLKEGFCNYYASAEVVLLRAAGIPARLAIGYAQGNANEQGTLFAVRELHSHAWPEVYFSNLGWVDFEPTAALPLALRPETPQAMPAETTLPSISGETLPSEPRGMGEERAQRLLEEEDAMYEELARREMVQRIMQWGFGGLGLVVLAGLLVLLRLYVKQARQERGKETTRLPIYLTGIERVVRSNRWLKRLVERWQLTPMQRAFIRVSDALKLMGGAAPSSMTPAEQVKALLRILPELRLPAESLLVQYQLEEFSQRPGDLTTAQDAARRIIRRAREVRMLQMLRS